MKSSVVQNGLQFKVIDDAGFCTYSGWGKDGQRKADALSAKTAYFHDKKYTSYFGRKYA